jgi:DNA mismatch repair protein MutL
VTFLLTSDDRTLLEAPAATDAAGRIAHIWPGDEAGTLVPLSMSSGGAEIRGLVQRPDAARPGVRRAYLFVNGRPFRSKPLLRAAERGYRTTIPQGARPWIFLYLQVEPGAVDVNVHPAKAEVRFRDDAGVEAAVEAAVRSVLEGEDSAATFEVQLTAPAMEVREATGIGTPEAEEESQMALFTAGPAVEPTDPGPEPAPALRDEVGAAPTRLWQVLRTYIIAETRDGLLIVDQHSAHERVMFERLMLAFESGGQESQRLLFPLTLRLTPAECAQVADLSGLLARSGFEVEGFGGDTVIVHAVPNAHPYFDAERAFREMIQELTQGSELVRSAKNQHERIAMSFACKGAIKAGQRLSETEMEELFHQLFATELPHHDVHGRPTIVRLSRAELERRFGRSG